MTVYLRPIPEDAPVLPVLRWPSERERLPTRCGRPHCGGWIMAEAPTPDEPTGEAGCLLCGRRVAELRHDGLRRPLTTEEWRALPSEQAKRGRPRTEVSL